APGAAHPGLGIGDQVLEIDRAALHQRQKAELHRRRVTTGIGEQPCAADLLTIDLAQAVDRLAHQLGRRVLHLVPALPLGDVAKKTTSQPRSACGPGSVNLTSIWRRKPGNIALTAVPASLREVMARSSTSGCCARSRSSSTPV